VTFVDLVRTCLRRWPVVLMGLMLTAVALVPVKATPGVYWVQADVVLLAPRTPSTPNSLGVSSASLIAFAGVLERQYNDGKADPATASSQVTLVDQGILDGVSVQLPNAGGQWNAYYNQPVLQVQAAGPSATAVESSITGVIARLRVMLRQRQADLGVVEANRVSADVSPRTPEILYYAGARNQAALLVIVVGMGLTIAAAVVIDVSSTRRRVEQRVPVPPETEANTDRARALAGAVSGQSRSS
jgi:hypothetical protein